MSTRAEEDEEIIEEEFVEDEDIDDEGAGDIDDEEYFEEVVIGPESRRTIIEEIDDDDDDNVTNQSRNYPDEETVDDDEYVSHQNRNYPDEETVEDEDDYEEEIIGPSSRRSLDSASHSHNAESAESRSTEYEEEVIEEEEELISEHPRMDKGDRDMGHTGTLLDEQIRHVHDVIHEEGSSYESDESPPQQASDRENTSNASGLDGQQSTQSGGSGSQSSSRYQGPVDVDAMMDAAVQRAEDNASQQYQNPEQHQQAPQYDDAEEKTEYSSYHSQDRFDEVPKADEHQEQYQQQQYQQQPVSNARSESNGAQQPEQVQFPTTTTGWEANFDDNMAGDRRNQQQEPQFQQRQANADQNMPTQNWEDVENLVTSDASRDHPSVIQGPPVASMGGQPFQATNDFDNYYQPPPSRGTPARQPDGDVEIEYNGGDIENPTKYYGELPEKAPPVVKKNKPSRMYCLTLCLIVLVILGLAVFLGVFLGTDEFKNNDVPRTAEIGSNAPTAAPTGTFLNTFSEFAPIRFPSCSFDGVFQPHVVDQCKCNDSVLLVQGDIRARYVTLRREFIPTVYATFEEDIASCSPRNQALLYLATGEQANLSEDDLKKRFAMAILFISMDGAMWNDDVNWLSQEDPCTWSGVRCTSDNEITSLSLHDNRLKGELSREIVLLSKLSSITMSENEIGGGIPSELYELEDLVTLNLSFNDLSESLSNDLSKATELRQLNLEGNAIAGRIPQSVFSLQKLELLNLASNGIVGDIPIALFDLPNLQHLNLGSNAITGSIPAEISQASALTSLTLGPNPISGTLQSTIRQLINLRKLILRGTNIIGRIPDNFAIDLQNLVELVIADNPSFGGTIPPSIGTMQRLETLDLSNNSLRNIIPPRLGDLPKLQFLYLNNNTLSGQIPPDLGVIRTLRELRLNDNGGITGTIPAAFENLENLEILRVEGNMLDSQRVANEVCSLRDASLTEFVTDCPGRTEAGVITGTVCPLMVCCTDCR